MAKTIEHYYDFSSPNAYFASMQLPPVAARYGAKIVHRPFFLGGLFKSLDVAMTPGMTSENKTRWSLRDFDLWSQKYGIPFRFPQKFPMNTVKPLRAALAILDRGEDLHAFAAATFRAYWVDGADISDDATLGEITRASGYDTDAVMALAQEQRIKDALRDATDGAARRGVFGAPTFFVGDDLVFGKDRLEFLEDLLRA